MKKRKIQDKNLAQDMKCVIIIYCICYDNHEKIGS